MSRAYVMRDEFADAAKSGTPPAAPVLRKQYVIEAVKQVEGEASRARVFCITTGAVDRDRDVINPAGWHLDSYRKNPTVLWAHDYSSLPLAKCNDIKLVNGRMLATAEFATHEMAQTVLDLVDGGFLNATSVGFRPIKFNYNEQRGGVDFEEQELLEFSIVPVPANPEALIEARSAGIDVEPVRAWAKSVMTALGDESLAERLAEAVLDEQVKRAAPESPDAVVTAARAALALVPAVSLKDLRTALVRAKSDDDARAALASHFKAEPDPELVQPAEEPSTPEAPLPAVVAPVLEPVEMTVVMSLDGKRLTETVVRGLPEPLVVKEGRVLSKKNEDALRQAADLITGVLSQMAAQPAEPDQGGDGDDTEEDAVTPAVEKAVETPVVDPPAIDTVMELEAEPVVPAEPTLELDEDPADSLDIEPEELRVSLRLATREALTAAVREQVTAALDHLRGRVN